MRIVAVINDPFEVNKILECLKRNNAPPFDKVEIKASWSSFSFTSIKEEISKGEVYPFIFSAMP
jgi:hypothetical protein